MKIVKYLMYFDNVVICVINILMYIGDVYCLFFYFSVF